MNKEAEHISELIMEVSLLEGPSRKLDAVIHCLLHPERITHPRLPLGYTMTASGSENRDRQLAVAPYILVTRGPAPSYTRLLDDAVRIYPAGLPPVIVPNSLRVCVDALEYRLRHARAGAQRLAEPAPRRRASA